MRQLTFVRVTEDGTSVVVATTDGNEEFALANNAALRDATHGHAVPRRRRARPARRAVAVPTAALPIGPREIQMRVRAGESPEQVADSCGVELARILRFATPVVEERLRIAGEARRARARRSTTEGQVVVFGEAVDERFLAHGLDAGDVTWSLAAARGRRVDRAGGMDARRGHLRRRVGVPPRLAAGHAAGRHRRRPAQ